VATVHNLLNENKEDQITSFDTMRFGILGIGWDGMRFMSSGHKIGDIVGRKKVIDETRQAVKKQIEYEIPVGNEAYSDDDGIYFIVPVALKKTSQEIWTLIISAIYKTVAEKSGGEIQPHIVYIDGKNSDNKTLEALAKAIADMRKKTEFRYDTFDPYDKNILNKLQSVSDGKNICPACGLHFAERGDSKEEVCNICKDRRLKSFGNHGNETVYCDEIAGDNKRLALIVARFGLDKWIDGTMIKSLFVKGANSIESELTEKENVKQFEQEQIKIKEFFVEHEKEFGEYNYKRIKDDIDSIMAKSQNERAKYAAYLYDKNIDDKTLIRNRRLLGYLLGNLRSRIHQLFRLHNFICQAHLQSFIGSQHISRQHQP
jgi:hypothetical protein